MSRRLNQEAAKITKYGGVSEVDAWNMVTINTAKLLNIDDRVGSIKLGKDADVVLWSDHYFDIDQDLAKRAAIKKERSLLMNMMLNEKNNGGKVQAPRKNVKRVLYCETEETELK